MRIEKGAFEQKVLDMAAHPNDPKIKHDYFEQVLSLSQIITKTYKIREVDDTVQDLVEYSIKKRLHTRIEPGRGAFSYYWRALGNHAWLLAKKANARPEKCYDMWENSYSDESIGEENMFRKLDWNLEDFQSPATQDQIDAMETVTASRGTRGRPKTKKDGEKASHWEMLYKQLRKTNTFTETDLVNRLPKDKQKSLKNPGKSVNYYMREIARREGDKLSVSNNGVQTVYMLVGANDD